MLKFVFSKKDTKIDEIFTVDLTITTYCQIEGEDFVNFCGLLRKRELYKLGTPCTTLPLVLAHYKWYEKNPTSLIYYELDFSSKCELKPYLCYAFAWLKGLYHFIVTQKTSMRA